MPEYLAPAVYVEEVSFRAPSIEGVGTTTTAFAGPTLTGPVGTRPELLTSFGDFQNIYGGYDKLSITGDGGDPKNTNYLALSVKGFFDNGGSQLYVSRVFAAGTGDGRATAGNKADNDVLVTARFPGVFANNQTVRVDLVATKALGTGSLPFGSLVAMVPSGIGALSLANDIQGSDTSIAVAPGITGTIPAAVQIDSEVLSVDSTRSALAVTRGASGTTAAPHKATAQALALTPIGILQANVAAADTTVTLAAAFSGTQPAFVQVGSEIMAVTGLDATKQIFTVTRGSNSTTAAAHNKNDAVFAAAVSALAADIQAADSVIFLKPAIAGLQPSTVQIENETFAVTADSTQTVLPVTRASVGTTAAAHKAGTQVSAAIGSLKTGVGTGDTPLIMAAALTGPTPALVQMGTEVMSVTAIDPTKTALTVVRAANGTTAATHGTDPVFAVTGFYGNGAGTTFKNGNTGLPSTIPDGNSLYSLTMRVTTFGAASQKISGPGASAEVQPMVYENLGFDPANPNYLGAMLGQTPPRHIDALQNQVAFTIGKNLSSASALLNNLFGTWTAPGSNGTKIFTLQNGNDGGEPESGDYDAALQQCEGLEDIAIVAAPGSSIFTESAAIINSLITHVSRQRAYRVAILDTPPAQLASDNEDVRARIDSTYAALYVPWIQVPNPLARTGSAIPAEVAIPPSGYMAGIYARNDEQKSVAKAPANEVILGALDLERNITFAEQALLNPLGINCLRFFPDRGFRVWGARTVSSDSEFKYINVRRYLIYLEHSIDRSTQWAVFENNGPALWARVKDSVDSFLNNEFVEGRLLGTSPAEAYFVRCDRTTMTQNDLDAGRMICLIGVALLKPAEFVIFRIGQKTADARS